MLVAAPEGLKALEKAHPDVELYTASIDDHLNEHGYIVRAWVMRAIRYLVRNKLMSRLDSRLFGISLSNHLRGLR